MQQEFFEKVLPSQGTYCAFAIAPSGEVYQRFVNTKVGLQELVADSDSLDVYIALNTFSGPTRLAKDAQWGRSFFVDLDCGPTKSYPDKECALTALNDFINKSALPPATILDSGTGVHAYWPFTTDIPAEEWKPYAGLFKTFCQDMGLLIDPAVTADAARIMRCPNTFNHKTDPPNQAHLLTPIYQYDFAEFKRLLGVLQPSTDLIESVPKGLDEDTRQLLRLDNHQYLFREIVLKSIDSSHGSEGCAQIAFIINNAKKLDYNMWYAGLSIASHCDDRETAIHDMSDEYDGYSREATEFKSNETLKAGPYLCTTFAALRLGVCETCPHFGKISSPIALGKSIKHADSPDTSSETAPVKLNGAVVPLPAFMEPFFQGKNHGIYYMPPAEGDEPAHPILVWPHDLYVTKRVWSAKEGEHLMIRHVLPNDPDRQFILKAKDIGTDEFGKTMRMNSVVADKRTMPMVEQYIYKWAQGMLLSKAESMRLQMGWSDKFSAFVIGNKEVRSDGEIYDAPCSNYMSDIASMLQPEGSYDLWRKSADYLNHPGMELHAFGLMCGLGSPLMAKTNTPGVCVCYYGMNSGSAKSGALYAGLSVFGNPTRLSTFKTTENAALYRMVILHNLLLARDEAGNMDPIHLSELVHGISQGSSKVRMNSSADGERDAFMNASLIGFFTANNSLQLSIETKKKTASGEQARMVSILVDQTPDLFANNQTMAETIFEPFKHNFGHIGVPFIQQVMKLGWPEVERRLRKWGDRFLNTFGNLSVYRFYRSLIAVTFAAAEIANEINLIQLDLERIYTVLLSHMIGMRDVSKINYVDYREILSAYLRKHVNDMLILDDKQVKAKPRNELHGRIDLHENKQYISKEEFSSYLSQVFQISIGEFIHRAREDGFIIEEVKQRLGRGQREVPQGSTIKLLTFPSGGVDESTR